MHSLNLKKIHHVAIICSDYAVSKKFYTEVLNLEIISETYRSERQSYKLDLKINDAYQIELFSFLNPPKRMSHPEACGLRHLAFEVNDIEEAILILNKRGVSAEPIRIDAITEKRFTFLKDPDGLPLELYEI